MSSVNKEREKRMYTDKKVNTDLIRRNPNIMKEFVDWYSTLKGDDIPDIEGFFRLSFKYQMWVWADFFYYCGIDITIGENTAYIFYRDSDKIRESIYPNLSGRREICFIEGEGDSPSTLFETAVAELICRIELPF